MIHLNLRAFLILLSILSAVSQAESNDKSDSAEITNNENLQKGIKYYTNKDYRRAFEWFEKSARQGDMEAQNKLGGMYYEGKGVAPNESKAFYWFEKSAGQGYVQAQSNLGYMYIHGHGVAQDDYKAFYWFEKSAEQGYALAQNNLGYMYIHGQGVAKDYRQAFEWYIKAADQDSAMAQYNIGRMYVYGHGVQKDYGKAYALLDLAGSKGSALAVALRDKIAKKMSAHAIDHAQSASLALRQAEAPRCSYLFSYSYH